MVPSVPVALRRHFDRISGAYYDIVDKLWYDLGYYHRRETDFVRERLPTRLNLSIDAGCGPGRHTPFLVSGSKRVIAVDISKEMLRLTGDRVASTSGEVDLVQADVRKLPFKPGVADFILNLELLEHLPGGLDDVSTVFAEFRRIFKPQGTLMTEAPLRRHRWWQLLGIQPASWKEVPRHMQNEYYEKDPLTVGHRYRDETLDALLGRFGFAQVSKEFVRVLPAGLVEKYPLITNFDRILEKLPIIHRFAREAIWLVRCQVL